MSESGVELRVEAGIAVLTVNRPHARNALSRKTITEFGHSVDAVASRADVRVLIVTGGAGAFIAGGDLRDLHDRNTARDGEALSLSMQTALDRLAALPFPVVAAVDGPAVGGGVEVALACDLRFAGATARFALRQIDLGVTTGWGGTRRLVALVGRARALDLLWSGVTLDAAEARDLGLVDRIAPGAQTGLSLALAWAEQVAARSEEAVRGGKALVRALDQEREPHDALERALFTRAWASDAHGAAVRRFVEARSGAREARAASPAAGPRGLFIVFEGIDGAGTTTQARLLSRWLERHGRTVHATAEPTKGPLGVLLRDALAGRVGARVGGPLPPQSIALLFAADRFEHLVSEIHPALGRGEVVVCDRYVLSSVAYQGLENDPQWVLELNAKTTAPDLVLFVDVSAEVAAARRARRGSAPDLYEVDALQVRIADAYRKAVATRRDERIVQIDGTPNIRAVQRAVRAAVRPLLADFPGPDPHVSRGTP